MFQIVGYKALVRVAYQQQPRHPIFLDQSGDVYCFTKNGYEKILKDDLISIVPLDEK